MVDAEHKVGMVEDSTISISKKFDPFTDHHAHMMTTTSSRTVCR